MSTLNAAFLGLTVILLTGASEQPSVPADRVVLCRPAVPDPLMQGRAGFVVIYDARFDEAGLLVEIVERSRPASVGSIGACVAEWRMPGSAGQWLSIVLRWEHGRGWVTMSLKSATLDLTLVDPSPSDYLRGT